MTDDELRQRIKDIIGFTVEAIYDETGVKIGHVSIDVSEPEGFPRIELDIEEID